MSLSAILKLQKKIFITLKQSKFKFKNKIYKKQKNKVKLLHTLNY